MGGALQTNIGKVSALDEAVATFNATERRTGTTSFAFVRGNSARMRLFATSHLQRIFRQIGPGSLPWMDRSSKGARQCGHSSQCENFQRNLRLVDVIEQIARCKDVTPAQLALAWVTAQGDNIVPTRLT